MTDLSPTTPASSASGTNPNGSSNGPSGGRASDHGVAFARPVTDLNGLPFLDDTFAATRLQEAVVAVRYLTARRAGLATELGDPGQWLAPAQAALVTPAHQPLPAIALHPALRDQVTAVLEQITQLVPAWEPVLRLPIRWALLYPRNGAISSSTRAWPQHIRLDLDAFASPAQLAEQILHELAHQWLYLIQEVRALQRRDERCYVLPSGTAQRSPGEVLGAAHVAAVLIGFHRAAARQFPQPCDRAGQLRAYGRGCLKVLRPADLTDAGLDIAHRLKEAL
ncbi:aKG-HExxH-type peptide beta-hydroxylase [Actinomadura kijaniata]|uniref:aKG-HExxH-type peptide beta-hydroxylase n=1 Tax=Actinomadura kijaniata TaxID=46161 RepID=UPI003F1AF7CB